MFEETFERIDSLSDPFANRLDMLSNRAVKEYGILHLLSISLPLSARTGVEDVPFGIVVGVLTD